MTSAGESRRSSVFALNVRPHTAIGTPVERAAGEAADLLDHPLVLALVHLDDALEQREVVAARARAVWSSAAVSFGKHEPP